MTVPESNTSFSGQMCYTNGGKQVRQVWYLGLVVKGASGVIILELLFLTSSFTHLEQQQAAGEATLPQN